LSRGTAAPGVLPFWRESGRLRKRYLPAGEIADLGIELRSGLARFAGQAVKGELYLFHVRHGRDDEVVAVNAGGWLHRSLYLTRRMTWGEKVLDTWAIGLRQAAPREMETRSV
jgi:hypothetical protein